ncbi:transporter substrate-binding domain-containing protein, partial [Caballeronia sp. M23-90]
SGIPFKKGNPKFQKAIDDAMTQLEADGTFAKISDKWFGIDVTGTFSAIPSVEEMQDIVR